MYSIVYTLSDVFRCAVSSIAQLTPPPPTLSTISRRAQADLVRAALKQRGFEQTKTYFAMRYWHPFTEEVSVVVLC